MARNGAFRKAIEAVNGTFGRAFWPLLRSGEVLGRAALSRSKTPLMANPVDISRARILEIGGSYFKLEYPEPTTSLWSMPRLPQEGEPIDGVSTPDRVRRGA